MILFFFKLFLLCLKLCYHLRHVTHWRWVGVCATLKCLLLLSLHTSPPTRNSFSESSPYTSLSKLFFETTVAFYFSFFFDNLYWGLSAYNEWKQTHKKRKPRANCFVSRKVPTEIERKMFSFPFFFFLFSFPLSARVCVFYLCLQEVFRINKNRVIHTLAKTRDCRHLLSALCLPFCVFCLVGPSVFPHYYYY